MYTEDHPADGEYSKFFVMRKDSSVQEVVYDQAQFSKRKDEIIALSKNYTFPQDDDYRDPDAGYYGGFQLLDYDLASKMRSAGKEILKCVGKKILTGKFNLTTISFPIKCMCP